MIQQGASPRLLSPATGIVLAGIALLAWTVTAGRQNVLRLNTDAIAYLRIAGYYAEGNAQLMVSGYWGPMLSWLIAPLLVVRVDPLIAGRLVLGGAAIVFWLGGLRLLRRFDLPTWAWVASAWLLAAASAIWSVENVTPDLLLAGLACFALSELVGTTWLVSTRSQIVAGLLWGLAYLTKAIALPLAFAATVLVALLHRNSASGKAAKLARPLALTLGACAAVALPWITVLSVKYGRPTFSTTAAIAYAVAGPTDVDRYHPFARKLHCPAPGRITSWEDPPTGEYRYWSPFQSGAYLRHQLDVFGRNAMTIARLVDGMDWVGVGLLSLVVGLLLRCHRHRWLSLLALTTAALYLPFPLNLAEGRYFYVVYPLALAASCSLATDLAELLASRLPELRLARFACSTGVVTAFAVPLVFTLPGILSGVPDPAAETAHVLAQRIQAQGRPGSVAGSATLGNGRPGLYLAFFLGQPWYGDAVAATAADYLDSGAALIVVRREAPIAGELGRHAGIRSLDPVLFTPEEQPGLCPVQVFERVERAGSR